MTSKQLTPEEEFSALSKANNTLTIVEYLSAVASIVGTILAFFMKEGLFASTPLTLSICLNLFNRTTADRLMKKSADIDLIETQRAFASSLQSLRGKSFNVEFANVDGQEASSVGLMLEDLASKVQQLEAFLEIQGSDYYSQGGTLNQEVSILRNHQLEMAQAIETLTSELEARPEGGIEQHEVLDHLERLSAVVYDLEQKTATLQVESSQAGISQAGPFQAEEDGTNTISTDEIEAVRAEIAALIEPLKAQMLDLETQVNAAAEHPDLDEEIMGTHIQTFLSPLQTQIASLEEQVTTQPRADDSSVGIERAQWDSLQGEVESLNAKVDSSLTQLSADISGFQGVMQSTHEQMSGIHHRLDSIQALADESAQSTNIDALQSKIDQANQPLQQQYEAIASKLNELNGLQDRLSEVHTLAQTSANSLNPETLRQFVDEANGSLRDQISAMEHRLHTEPEAMKQHFQDALIPLKAHLLDFEQRLNQVLRQDSQAKIQETIRPIQDQLTHLEHRLNELPTQQPDQSQQIQLLQGQIADIQSQLESISHQVSSELQELPTLVERNVEHRVSTLNLVQPPPAKNAQNELDDLLKSLDF